MTTASATVRCDERRRQKAARRPGPTPRAASPMPSAAARMRGTARRDRASRRKCPRRCSRIISNSALTQPAIEVAAATPTWPNVSPSPSTSVSTRFVAHRGEADLHRRARIVPGEKAGRHHLDQNEGGQAPGISGKRRGGRVGRGRTEGAALEQHRHDRPGGHAQPDRRGKGQQQRQFEPAILRIAGARLVAEAHLARQRRQDRRADRDARRPQAAAG